MGIIFIAPVFALACWIIYSSARILQRNELQPAWRQRAIILVAVGVALGIWLSFFAEFQPAANAKFSRAPIPIVIWQFENNVWKKIVPPEPMRVLATITNFISGIAAGFLPIKIAAFLKQAKIEFISEK